jgi:hypothetical protein
MLLSNPTNESTRIDRALRAYTTRRLPPDAFHSIDTNPRSSPLVDDVILARVARVGRHRHLESVSGRCSDLSPGDEIIVAFGASDAPDLFDARVPKTFGPCHLAAGGGTAATLTVRGSAITPTEIVPIGFLLDTRARRVNLARYGLPRPRASGSPPVTFASFGTAQRAGKTTTAASLIRGLIQAGKRVGAARITGTGSGSDPQRLRDAGAFVVLDFVDVGHASTSGLSVDALCRIVETVQDQMTAAGVDALVLELADGLLRRETELLLRSPWFGDRVDGALLSGSEPTGAAAGVRCLNQFGMNVLALSGTLTAWPAHSLTAAASTGVRTLSSEQLRTASTALSLFERAAASRRELTVA